MLFAILDALRMSTDSNIMVCNVCDVFMSTSWHGATQIT